MFIPFGLTTFGAMSEQAKATWKRLVKFSAASTDAEDAKAAQYLYRRQLQVAVMRQVSLQLLASLLCDNVADELAPKSEQTMKQNGNKSKKKREAYMVMFCVGKIHSVMLVKKEKRS